MAKKGGMPIYKTVQDYINNQTEDAQVLLNEIRQIIKDIVPEMEEAENCKSALFILETKSTEKHQLMMGAYAKYISFYPFPSTMAVFSEELKDFKQGKGSVQFPFNKPLPVDIIKQMIIHRKNELKN
ncbi:MAG: iron chaperone [Flavobacteriales bacterium]